ncbi:ferric reductase-like transmembrane domain-containing protein [Cerasicoccus maritimus]|uniref:ferric reductase-like transmembrane domain-containing protein n=1 Tax=Cerasicoccus maritimus TaxID=490089 RepID=UPI00285250F8|nr:ferric reductase-like transmembrane domain-containing protein [Cerasicoccus maritimus]
MIAKLLRKKSVFFPLLTLPAAYAALNLYASDFRGWDFSDFQDFLGNTAMGMLILVLSLTPLTRLLPKWGLAQAFNGHRRAIGISCYLYAVSHFSCYLIAMPARDSMVQDIQEFFYLKVGLIALLLLTPLFLTSSNLMVKFFGYKPWKLLHRLAYFAAAFVFLHRSFGEKIQLFQTILIFLPLIVLEALRILQSFFGLFKKKPPAAVVPQPAAPAGPAWQGYRSFRVDKKQPERGGICSFYLKPTDGEPLPHFKPGQYLTFQFAVPSQEKPVMRCYSLSDAPGQDYYRISVKRQTPPADKPDVPPGVSSNYLHDEVSEGDVLQVKAPAGNFTLEDEKIRRVVFISSGVGMTPVLSMLKHRVQAGLSAGDEVWFFYGARSREEHFMAEHLEAQSKQYPQLNLRVCYSRPQEDIDILGVHFHHKGRVGVDILQKELPDNAFDFYICGPGPMMADVVHGLEEWDVAPERIHFEAFGPSTVKRTKPLPKKPVAADAETKVTFAKSKQELVWTGQADNLLEFAEAAGMKLPFGCRAGVCGACKQNIVEGDICYADQPAADPGKGACLLCQAKPKGNLTIDA